VYVAGDRDGGETEEKRRLDVARKMQNGGQNPRIGR
jgi:hypothetical protein